MLKCLSIQLQPSLDSSHQPEEVITKVKTLGCFPEVDVIDEDGGYVNLNFFSEQMPAVWAKLQSGLLEEEPLGAWVRKVGIIVCEGEQGWDDCVLLSHPDPEESLGTL